MTPEPLESLSAIIASLDEVGVDHMLAGSFASSHHGVARSTADIDLVIAPNRASFERLLTILDNGRYYLPVETAREEYRVGGQFNVVDLRTGWKIDLIFRKDRLFSQSEFARRRAATVAGVPVFVATAEDTIVAKLEWAKQSGSDRQLLDVIAVLQARSGDLDDAYLDRWAGELGLASMLTEARAASST